MNTEKLEKIIRTHMRKKRTPGMAVTVLKDGQPFYAKGFGARDLKQQKAMDADTLLGIGSITKSFTAFAIMQLQEQGKLTLDDSAAQYLEAEPFRSRPGITIRHMLCHASGIPAMDAGMLSFHSAFNDFSTVYPATSRDDFLAHMADAEEFILFEPGEAFFYNNDMYTCLGFIIEQLSGLSFQQFIQQHILDPLDMKRAVFTQQGLEDDSNAMTGYLFEPQAGNSGKTAAKAHNVPIGGHVQAPGGLYVSMNEMLHYAQCLMDGGKYQGKQLLKPESVETLFQGIIATPYGEGNAAQYALGWSVEPPSEKTPHPVVHHGGGMGTSQSFLILVPALKLAVMAAENAGTGIAPIVGRSVLALAQDQEPDEVVDNLRVAKVLSEVMGVYHSQYTMYELKLSVQGTVVQADVHIDDGHFSFPVVIDDLDALTFSVYSVNPKGAQQPRKIQFFRDPETQKVAFASYDRFMYRRV